MENVRFFVMILNLLNVVYSVRRRLSVLKKCIRNFLGVREIPYIQPIIEVLSVSITLLTRDTTLIIHIDM